MTDVKTKIIAFGQSFIVRDQRDSLCHCCAVRQRLRHLPRIGSGGCRSTKANRLCFLVSTAAAATVTALMLLHRPSSDSLLCCTRALTEGVGLQVIVSIERCISHTKNDSNIYMQMNLYHISQDHALVLIRGLATLHVMAEGPIQANIRPTTDTPVMHLRRCL